MSRASAKTLDKLHEALARTFKEILEEGEVVTDKDGNAMRVKPGASTLNAIRQFLKDNGVEAVPDNNGEVRGLGLSNLPFPAATDVDEHGLPNRKQ